MKKVFAIIAIMVVLVGAVFADGNPAETHTLHIKTVVDTIIPQFQLKIASTYTDADYITNNDNPINQFDDGASYRLGGNTDQTAIDVSDAVVLDKDGEQAIVFSAIIANQPKTSSHGGTSRSWTLAFSGGAFAVTKAGTDATITPTIATSNGADYNDGVTIVLGTGNNANTATLTLTANQPSKAGIEIVKATYTWTGDRTVDPGTYETDVVMTVTQN